MPSWEHIATRYKHCYQFYSVVESTFAAFSVDASKQKRIKHFLRFASWSLKAQQCEMSSVQKQRANVAQNAVSGSKSLNHKNPAGWVQRSFKKGFSCHKHDIIKRWSCSWSNIIKPNGHCSKSLGNEFSCAVHTLNLKGQYCLKSTFLSFIM